MVLPLFIEVRELSKVTVFLKSCSFYSNSAFGHPSLSLFNFLFVFNKKRKFIKYVFVAKVHNKILDIYIFKSKYFKKEVVSAM